MHHIQDAPSSHTVFLVPGFHLLKGARFDQTASWLSEASDAGILNQVETLCPTKFSSMMLSLPK